MTYSQHSDHSTRQHQAIYATERAKLLFGCYRRGDANDPDSYVASIAAVLSTYDPEIIRRVTDPRTGISTTEKFRSFMPNSGELKAYCDEQQAVADRVKRYAALPKPQFRQLPAPPPLPGRRANLYVKASIRGYDAMVERARTADEADYRYDPRGGIHVPLHWWHEHRGLSSQATTLWAKQLLDDADKRDREQAAAAASTDAPA